MSVHILGKQPLVLVHHLPLLTSVALFFKKFIFTVYSLNRIQYLKEDSKNINSNNNYSRMFDIILDVVFANTSCVKLSIDIVV